MSAKYRNLKHCVDYTRPHSVFTNQIFSIFSKRKRFCMLLSVSKWRRILRGKTETKSAPKTIFSGNGNGLKNFTFLSTREQKNVHTVYVKQDCVFKF